MIAPWKNGNRRREVFERIFISILAGSLLLPSFYSVPSSVQAFTSNGKSLSLANRRNGMHTVRPSRSSRSSLLMGISSSIDRIEVSSPPQDKCESLGVREWPQQSKRGTWNEEAAPDASLARYILEGKGLLTVVANDDASGETKQEEILVKPGMLVEINVGAPSVRLEWKCDEEIILLTPGFEEGNVLLGVVAGVFVLFAALLSGALG